jgi:uncharacterized protein (DUF4415 family)
MARKTLNPGLSDDHAPFRGRDPEKPDHENPEWTDDDFAEARSVWDFPELVEVLQKHGKLGRPPLPPEDRKIRVTLHLDPDIVSALKADGRGWQTRANAALRRVLGLTNP